MLADCTCLLLLCLDMPLVCNNASCEDEVGSIACARNGSLWVNCMLGSTTAVGTRHPTIYIAHLFFVSMVNDVMGMLMVTMIT